MDQAPSSGRRSFLLLLTAADRPFEILGRDRNKTSRKIINFFLSLQDSYIF